MRFNRRSPCLVLTALVLLLLPAAAMAADVDVFVEGAYNASNLDVYIYATINADNLCSYGVKLHYNSLLTTPIATKNVAVWYMGSSSPGNTYMDPAVNLADRQITFIGGKLDTSTPTSPTEGVTGTRVLLGSVRFVRTEGSLELGPTAETHFGITAELGKAPPYANFVTTGGTVKDGAGVSFMTKVRERGDSDGNGEININDVRTLRQLLGASNESPWVDCDADGDVTINDVRCLRQKL